MASDTALNRRNLVIYEVYVRNHGPHGTFADVEADLPRLAGMGVDVVWFMPIHPIGKQKRKGREGSPYAIQNYREVNPAYGSKADFKRLIDRAHDLGLKIMIDVVYNHTAADSVLIEEHPAWFHQDENGMPVTTVPAWSDVIDLKHPNPDLSAYLIETLRQWVQLGVDGFRCDVASLVPLDFWLAARAAVAQVKPDVIWLAESVSAPFVALRRLQGLTGHSDGEIYQAFDITYDYDIWSLWLAAVAGEVPVTRYLEMLRFQDCIYPANYVKMRCVENHDQRRIMALAPTRGQALAWTAFQAFNRGAFMIYAGQESAAEKTPSLFEIDKVDWGRYELQPFLTSLARLKKHPAMQEGRFVLLSGSDAIEATWLLPDNSLYGVFNVYGRSGEIETFLPDGDYSDLLSGAALHVRGGRLALPASAVIIGYATVPDVIPQVYVPLLDYRFEVN